MNSRWLACLLALLVADTAVSVDDSAVALVYHHVDDSAPASTSVTPAQFAEHLEFLHANDFNVVTLAEIVAAWQDGQALPRDTVAITFDDAYESVYTTAAPMLAERGWSFSVFVATDAIDQGLKPYMSWDQLRELAETGADLQNHGATHDYLVRRIERESEADWRRRVRADIDRAQLRLLDETGVSATLFAFPYGEYSRALLEVVAATGLVGVGQHSGAAHPTQMASALARFPVNRSYASLDTLRDKVRSRAMPVTVVSSTDTLLQAGTTRPVLEFRLGDAISQAPETLACYVAGQPRAEVRVIDDRIQVRATQPLPVGRSRYTCTMPSVDEPGRFHWLSFPWIRSP